MDESGSALPSLLFIGLLFVGLYLLAIRPQRARLRALQAVRESVTTGSRVITTAGIHGSVVALDGDDVVLEIAPGVRVRFLRAAVVRVLDPLDSTGRTDGVDPVGGSGA